MNKRIILVTVGILAAQTAFAEINVGMTAEWLSHKSELVALATPLKVENIKGPGDVWFTKTQFRLDEVIKGPQTDGDTATVFDYSYNTNDVLGLAVAVKTKKTLLILCNVAEHRFKEIDGRYIFTETHMFKSAYFQGEQVKALYTPDFKHPSGFSDLLKRVRSQVTHERRLFQRYWGGTVEKQSVEVPFDSEIHRSLYAGSSCYLLVPKYKQKKTEAPTMPSNTTSNAALTAAFEAVQGHRSTRKKIRDLRLT